MSDLFIEIGSEELPSGSVLPLAKELSTALCQSLSEEGLSFGCNFYFATPRRIAVWVKEVSNFLPQTRSIKRGPAYTVGLSDEGKPTQALIGFAKSCGVSVDALTTLESEKGIWWVYESITPQRRTKELIPEIIQKAVKSLVIKKPMRWGEGECEFARPVHWVVLLFDQECVEMELLGITTGNQTRGHRFLAPQAFELSNPEHYAQLLEKSYVIAEFERRRQKIIAETQVLAKSKNAQVLLPDELLDEVCSIVEWPTAMMGQFDDQYLKVPAEVLITAINTHQKCFVLLNDNRELLPNFITVSNINPVNSHAIIEGNEKVMHARLSDAEFFYHTDLKTPLEEHHFKTKTVVFQAKLGSLYDKSQRLVNLMRYLANLLSLNLDKAERAAMLSKCDLMTGMVGEFPDLQGVMGYYYALAHKEDKEVAIALKEQYMPRFSQDALPNTDLGFALSLADRVDTLVGNFAIGQKPTGEKDPFKLRRHALAIAKMLLTYQNTLSLNALLAQSYQNYETKLDQKSHPELINEVKHFILDRVLSYYQSEKISTGIVQAVMACQDDDLFDLNQRVKAIIPFMDLPEMKMVAGAFKRVNQILKHAELKSVNQEVIISQLYEPQEKNLYEALIKIDEGLNHLLISKDYTEMLKVLTNLSEPVDEFFNNVMVMSPDQEVRQNRLLLLKQLKARFLHIADLSFIQHG